MRGLSTAGANLLPMRKPILVLGILAVASLLAFTAMVPLSPPPVDELALAAQPKSQPILHVSPEKFENLIVEPTATCSIDFGNLGGSAASAVSPCRESSCAVLGAAIGDTCLASTTYGANDGGTVLPAESTLSCRVTVANTALVKLCWQSTDAGAFDPGAGLYRVRIIH